MLNQTFKHTTNLQPTNFNLHSSFQPTLCFMHTTEYNFQPSHRPYPAPIHLVCSINLSSTNYPKDTCINDHNPSFYPYAPFSILPLTQPCF
ncbi:hypothetical protein Hanom_Chr06g00521681 [Helianthus anomalus]